MRAGSGAGRAPPIAHFRDLGLDLIPGSGLLAAAVPGSTAAWLTLLRDHGTATLRDVLEPAIHYAAYGHPRAAADRGDDRTGVRPVP